jgi:ABC-2 type transport system permease protein
MNRIIMISKIEFKLLTRNFLNVFFALIFPLMMLLLFGSMYGNKPSDFYNGYGAMDVSIPGYIGMIIAVTGLMTLPLTIAQYRERKILKRFAATPINPIDILISQMVVNFILTILGILLLVVVGKIAFNLHFMGNVFIAISSFLLITLCIFSIGLLIASLSSNSKSANAISYIVYFPMLFLSGATMPLEMMPKGVLYVSKALPLTYGVELFKGVWLGKGISNYILDIIVLFLVLVLCTLISIKTFKWE